MANTYTLPGVLLTGTHAGRPAANTVAKGTLYAETDTGQTYQSDGSSWSAWGAAAGTGMTNPMTTTGDMIYSSSGSTPARLAVGTSGQFLKGGTTPAWASPYAGSTLQRVSITGGSITLTNSKSAMTEASSSLRLTLPAATGDVIMVGLSVAVSNTGSGEIALDTATIVSGTVTNQFSAGTRGVGHGLWESATMVLSSTLTRTLVSGDISGGNVIVSPTYVNPQASGTATLLATTTYALTYWAVNLKQ